MNVQRIIILILVVLAVSACQEAPPQPVQAPTGVTQPSQGAGNSQPILPVTRSALPQVLSPTPAAAVHLEPTPAPTASPPSAGQHDQGGLPLPATAPTALPAAGPTIAVLASPTATLSRPAVPTPTALPPTSTPSPGPTQAPSAVVQADLVNVRAGPATAHPVLGQLSRSQKVTLLSRTDGDPPWYEVCCTEAGRSGWVRGDLMEVAPAAASVALASRIPTPPPTPSPAPTAAAAVRAAAPPAPPAQPLAPPPPPPAGVPSVNPFTGLPGGNLARRPVFVCLNNDVEARPQYGLNAADIVYEYVMEGRAITRYTALYWSQDAPRIGPVRSARLINVQMTPLYGAALLCSGASSGVRFILKHQVHFPYLDVDLDDPSNTVYSFSVGNDYRTRLQTDTGRLEKYVRTWNVNTIPGTRGLRFGDYGGGTPVSRVAIPYPALSRTAWTWNGNQWARSDRNGGPYLDAATGGQVTADNVVIQWAAHEPTDIVEDSLGTTGIRIVLVGSGPVKVLRDGKMIDGVWRADDPNQPPEFFDAGGSAIPLRPGRTWFEIVEPYYQVQVQP